MSPSGTRFVVMGRGVVMNSFGAYIFYGPEALCGFGELIEGVRVSMGDDWVAAIPDADRATFHVVAEAANRDRAQRLAEEFRDRITGWRKEPA